MKYLNKIRWTLIILTNLFFLISILKANFWDQESDTNGVFTLVMIIAIIVYNLYILFLEYLKSFMTKDIYLYIFLIILTSLPTFLIIYVLF